MTDVKCRVCRGIFTKYQNSDRVRHHGPRQKQCKGSGKYPLGIRQPTPQALYKKRRIHEHERARHTPNVSFRLGPALAMTIANYARRWKLSNSQTAKHMINMAVLELPLNEHRRIIAAATKAQIPFESACALWRIRQ